MALTLTRAKTTHTETSVHIHIQGKVQGVGFRPFVYRLAQKYRLKGRVNNGMDGVHIDVMGSEADIDRFCAELKSDYPKIAAITGFSRRPVSNRPYNDFQVTESDAHGHASVLILPDLDTCDDCLEDLKNPDDRRFNYGFITCTNCGPRYSIITQLPYDRPNTTMVDFPFCDRCRAEYLNPADRRFYSQTNSCHECGIRLSLMDAARRVVACDLEAVDATAGHVRAGKIVAIKGIGGYLLLVDAQNEAAVQTLRARKHRPVKPFALMYSGPTELLPDVDASERELDILLGREKPIVILKKKAGRNRIAASVAPGQDTWGAMLPYAPLHHLLMERLQRPVVATSANISGSPILCTEDQVFELLGDVADFFLVHDREIAVPQDDSVIRVAPNSRTPIFLRRSRSFAPLVPNALLRLNRNRQILALGGQQKSTVSLSHEKNIYVSQYLGDLSNYESEQNFFRVIDHFKRVLNFVPEVVVADAHPQYSATMAGAQLAEELQAPFLKVQHHRAHFWAVLAENHLLFSEQPVLGVIWDGTGWGEDGAVWGSEFFLLQNGEMQRVARLNYFPHLLGDKSALEPRLPALALWGDMPEAQPILREKFSGTEWKIYETLLRKQKNMLTSSMGRLFDAVASLLGLADKVSFEGEAAMLLERQARRFMQSRNCAVADGYGGAFHFDDIDGDIYFGRLLSRILQDIAHGESSEVIAFKFHLALAELVGEVALKTKARRVAFSGGVLQNAVLVDLLHTRLADEYQLYFHKHLPPNDENISFGQMVCAAFNNGWLLPDRHNHQGEALG